MKDFSNNNVYDFGIMFEFESKIRNNYK